MPGAGRPSCRAPGPRETECEPRGHRAVPPLSRAGTQHKAPTAPAPCGSSAGRRRGLRSLTLAAQDERKIKQQPPPHRSGRTRGEPALPRFPPAANTGDGNDALRGALPANTATRKSARGCGGGASRGSVPRLLLFFLLARSQPIVGGKEGPAGWRARRWTVPLATAAGCHAQPSADVTSVDSTWKLCSGLSERLSAAGVTTALSPTFPNLRGDYFPFF